MTTDWRPLGAVDPQSLTEARLQAHYAAQWLARAARGYIAAKPDDSHTNLGWDDSLDGFATHPLPGGRRLVLQFSDLTLILVDRGGATRSFPLNGRGDKDVRTWLGEELATIGLDPALLDAPSPYAMPPDAIARGAAYDAAVNNAALQELAAWFANADAALGRIRERYTARRLTVSPVRCWPHHFDIASLILLKDGDPEHAQSVNVGLSPGDQSYAEPYFYVSPWPYPDAGRLPAVPKLAHWHTQGFLAAIVPGSRIVAAASESTDIEALLNGAIEAAIASLG